MSLIAPSYYVSGAGAATNDGAGTIAGAAADDAYAVLVPALGDGLSPDKELAVIGLVGVGIVLREATGGTFLLALADLTSVGIGDAGFKGVSERYGLSGPSNAKVWTHWTDDGPTSAGVYRQATLPASIGAHIEWEWDPTAPLIIPTSPVGQTPAFCKLGIGVFNGGAGAGPAIDVYFKWAEYANIAGSSVINPLAPQTPFVVFQPLVPMTGPVAGGTFVTATGRGLSNVLTLVGSTVGVVAFTIVDDNTITFTTPLRGGAGVETFTFATAVAAFAAPFVYT